MSHIDLLDYRKIWSTIQEAPSTASAARELGLNLSRVHKIEDMLDGFYVNGALEDWLRIVERLRSIQRERGARSSEPHSTSNGTTKETLC